MSALAYDYDVRQVPVNSAQFTETEAPAHFARVNMQFSTMLFEELSKHPELAERLDGAVVVHAIQGMDDITEYNRFHGLRRAREQEKRLIVIHWFRQD